jgi:hypothetical protein
MKHLLREASRYKVWRDSSDRASGKAISRKCDATGREECVDRLLDRGDRDRDFNAIARYTALEIVRGP